MSSAAPPASWRLCIGIRFTTCFITFSAFCHSHAFCIFFFLSQETFVREWDRREWVWGPYATSFTVRTSLGNYVLNSWLFDGVAACWLYREPNSPVFLGAFSKLRKAAISLVMSVRPSVRMEQLGSHWKSFREIWYLRIFRKPVEKTRVSLKPYKNKWCFAWRPVDIVWHISLVSFQN
jgi:hypothetical protein